MTFPSHAQLGHLDEFGELGELGELGHLGQGARPSYGPSLSPDGRALAYIVVDNGYPRAVQRPIELNGGIALGKARDVRLPIQGPITKVRHSPDGKWLACQIAPHAGNRSQVWMVTTDPDDPRAIWVDGGEGGSRELVGWDGLRVAVTIEGEDEVGESRLVDPVNGHVQVVDRREEGRLVDAWSGSALVRVGPRCDRYLVMLRDGVEVPLGAPDPGSLSDPGTILDDHRPRRMPDGTLWPPAVHARELHATDSRADSFGRDPQTGEHVAPGQLGGYVRMLVRTDHGADRLRLDLVTVTPGGVWRRTLAARDDADLDEFTVSADTTRAALLWNVDGGRSELQVLELLDGTLHDPIPLPGEVATGVSLNGNGRALALTVEGPGRRRCVALTSLYTWGPGGSARTDAKRWILIDQVDADPDTVEPELLRFAAHDGLELTGWLYRAPTAASVSSAASTSAGASGVSGASDPSAPGPVLVYFHGGPEGQARPEFSDVFGPMLAHGVSVFAPNVRGSSGSGRAFWHADDHEKRWDGIRDAVSVVDFLVTAGIAEPGRLAVAGRSYGGYLTNAVLAFHPGHFVCGVAICGMSEFAAFFRETEPWIGRASYSKYGHPERDAELLRELSPIHRAADVRVPMLFIHGGNDTNVPVGESPRMAEALRAAGSQAHTLIVPGEGHDFTRPENRALLAHRLADFVAEHVLAPA